MSRSRLVNLTAMFALIGVVGLAACDTDDSQTAVDADTTLITEPTTETVEIQRPTEDTLMVEERVETEIDVDTTRVDGDDVRSGTTRRDTIR